jgi:hypothetical protein
MISQLNVEPLFGINDRRFLDDVVPRCRPHVIELGRLRLVPVDVMVEALRGIAPAEGPRTNDEVTMVDDDQPTTAAGVLERLGLEVAR